MNALFLSLALGANINDAALEATKAAAVAAEGAHYRAAKVKVRNVQVVRQVNIVRQVRQVNVVRNVAVVDHAVAVQVVTPFVPTVAVRAFAHAAYDPCAYAPPGPAPQSDVMAELRAQRRALEELSDTLRKAMAPPK